MGGMTDTALFILEVAVITVSLNDYIKTHVWRYFTELGNLLPLEANLKLLKTISNDQY